MRNAAFFDNITKRFETIQETILTELMSTRKSSHKKLIELNGIVVNAMKIIEDKKDGKKYRQ